MMWLTVIAIALVQGAISIAWLIYRLYLPQLLVQWGLTQELAATLIIIENLLGFIVEPFFGSLSDRQQRWLGTRFPLISLGVILASSLFIALPSLVIFGQPDKITWLFPLIAIAWALAMTIFRSPVIALLGNSTTLQKLPLAASFLTAIVGIIATFRPIINNFILGLGSIFAFSLGSMVMLGSVAFLRKMKLMDSPGEEREETEPISKLIPKLLLIVATAFSLSWGVRLLMATVTKAVDNNNFMILVGILLATVALAAGNLAVKIGNYKAMVIGISGSILILFLLNLTPHPLLLGLALIILLISLNLVLNGAIPLVIDWMPKTKAGLGIGIYFGSFGAAMSLFEIIFKPGAVSPISNTIIGVASWLLLAVCINIGYKKP